MRWQCIVSSRQYHYFGLALSFLGYHFTEEYGLRSREECLILPTGGGPQP